MDQYAGRDVSKGHLDKYGGAAVSRPMFGLVDR